MVTHAANTASAFIPTLVLRLARHHHLSSQRVNFRDKACSKNDHTALRSCDSRSSTRSAVLTCPQQTANRRASTAIDIEAGRKGRRRRREEISLLGATVANEGVTDEGSSVDRQQHSMTRSSTASRAMPVQAVLSSPNPEGTTNTTTISGRANGPGASTVTKMNSRNIGSSSNNNNSSSSSSSNDDSSNGRIANTTTRVTPRNPVRFRRGPGTKAGGTGQAQQKQKDYLHLIKATGVRGAWREVASLVREMGERGVKGNVYIYNTAIAAFARCGRPQEAEALLSVMLERDSVAPDTISYNSAINAHARRGNLDAARRLLQRMLELESMGGGLVKPDQCTYNSVANAAAKRGDSAAAGEILGLMTKAGIAPSLITYNSCLAACKPKGDLRRALLLLELMKDDGIHPDQRSYSAAIATAGTRGLWEEALGFLETMRREGLTPDRVTFNTAIAAVASSGRCQTAFSLLAEMKKEGVNPDQISYNGVLSACGQAGEWRAALRVIDDMRKAGMPPNAYNYSAAIHACGKAGRQHEALELLERMREAGLRSDTIVYNAAIDACSVSADWRAALQLLQEMKDGAAAAAAAATEAPGGWQREPGKRGKWDANGATSQVTLPPALPPPPDVVSYASAITACARAKRVEEALDLLSELRVNEAQAAAAAVRGCVSTQDGRRWVGVPVPNSVTYSAGLFACLNVGDVRRGAELLGEMIAAGLKPNRIHCETMVAAWSAEGEPKRAVALMRRLQAHGFEPSLYTYETIVWGFAQVADWEAAVRFLGYVLGLGLQPSVRSWDAAITACSQAGLWERALSLLAEMRKQGIRPSRVTYTAAVVGINRRRRISWAPKLANLARLLRNGPGAEAGQEDEEVETTCSDGGESWGRACDVSERGLEGGAREQSPEEFDSSIEALGDADDADGATNLLRVMRREGFHASPRAYRSVIYACARVGLLTEAMALAKEMQNSSSKAVSAQQQVPSSSCRSAHDTELANGLPPSLEVSPSLQATAINGEQSEQRGRNEDGGDQGHGGGGSTDLVSSCISPVEGNALTGRRDPTSEMGVRVDSRNSNPNNEINNRNGGAIDEDQDAAEFNIAVVYNCIICNFARAATGGSRSGGSTVCDHRPHRAVLPSPEVAAEAPVSRVGEASSSAAATNGARSASSSSRGDQRRRQESRGRSSDADDLGEDREEIERMGPMGGSSSGRDQEGEGLVALLLDVAHRAQGSLTEEVANGGVEIDHDGDA